MSSLRAWSFVGASCLAACGGSSEAKPAPEPAAETKPVATTGGEQPEAAPAEAPQPQVDIAALFATEQPQAAVHLIGTPDGSLKGRIEALSTPTVTVQDGFVAISAPNASTAVQCFSYPEHKDAAEVLRVLAASTLGEAAPMHRWVDVHGDQTAGWPYLVARAHYFVDTPQGKMAGDFKIAASARGATTVACLFDAPGHYATFERVVRGLLESLDTAENRALKPPLEAEITRTRLAGRMVSLSLNETEKQGDRRVITSYESMLTIGPEGTLATSDDASTVTYRKGRLEKGTYAQANAGQVDYALELVSKKDVYSVTGSVQDKPFTAEFTVKGGLPDNDRADAAACQVHKGKKPMTEVVSYVPDADPSAPTPMRFEKSQDPASHLRVSLGVTQGLVMDVTVDAECAMDKGLLRAGDVAIEIERLWRDKNGK